MIEQLVVKDYILFESGDVEFDRDMAVITGETGAGKSLLIDAIGYLCGQRASGDIVRSGAEKAVLTMVLSEPDEATAEFLAEAGFESEEQLVITRTVSRTGKSTVRINGQPATLAFLKKLTARLIDIHSQMDTITLMDPKVQMDLLDQYAANQEEKEAVKAAYAIWHQMETELDEAKNETFSDEELDYTTARLNEIDEADIKEGELEDLQERIKAAESLSRSEDALQEAVGTLVRENGLTDSLWTLSRALKRIDNMEGEADKYQTLYHEASALKEELQDKLDSLRQESRNLDEMQEREQAIRRLFRKYGGSWQAMMETRKTLEDKVDRILNRQDYFEKLEKKLETARKDLAKKSEALSKTRKAVIPALEQAIIGHAKDLMLEKARFEIKMEDKPFSADGTDAITFMASMNPGQPLTPIRQSASGGELSRLMLALKTVFQTETGIDTIIFDEIDTGVSGRVALAMGHKMHLLAENRQVLCITHLASVAVHGDEHFRVAKETDGDRTLTSIKRLEGEEIPEELAVMASGQVTESTVSSMKELQQKVKHGQSALPH